MSFVGATGYGGRGGVINPTIPPTYRPRTPYRTGMASSAALYINSTYPTTPPSILLSWLPYLLPSILLNTSSVSLNRQKL